VGSPIFISYSHRDAKWLTILQTYLKTFVWDMEVLLWDDTQIAGGDEWRAEIETSLSSAKVAILLVSQDFIASDFIRKQELPTILERASRKALKVCWIPVRASNYKSTQLERFQAFGDPERPLALLPKAQRDAELVKICGQIAKAIEPAVKDDGGAHRPSAHLGDMCETGHLADDGIRALIELMNDPSVRDSVATFKAVFSGSCSQIETLSFYKRLHDLLHTLQFDCYNYLMTVVNMARALPDNPAVWEHVIKYELTLQRTIGELQSASASKFAASPVVSWVPKLIATLEDLRQAVEDNDPERIASTLQPISSVLAVQPGRLNDRLDEAARALPLPPLVNALTNVSNSLNQPSVNPLTLQRFTYGVTALRELDERLTLLNDSHGKWQEIDIENRRIEGSIASNTRDLEASWSELKAMCESLCTSGEGWARDLSEEMRKLDDVLALKDTEKIKRSFQRYKTLTSYRFYDVDCSLKDLCEELRKIGEPLAMVWEML
jgi:hypothetical protein